MVTTDPDQLLIEKLQSLVERTRDMVVPRTFFLTLYEYLEIYDNEDKLATVTKTINQLKENDTKKETRLGELAKKEMRQAHQALLKIRADQKLEQNHLFQEGIQQFEAYEREDGSIESSSGPINGRYSSIVYSLTTLRISDNPRLKELISAFCEKDYQGNVTTWTFSPSYLLLEEETKYIQRLLPTKIWYSWDKLVSFYGLYKDYEKIRDDKLEKKEILAVMNLNMLFRELNDVMNYNQDAKRYLREFNVEEYKVHLQRIFDYTKGIVLTKLDNKGLQKSIHASGATIYEFDDGASTIIIDSKRIRFKKDTRKLTVLKILMRKTKVSPLAMKKSC